MQTLRPILLAGTIAVAFAAHGQNTPARSTPQTTSAAPASVNSAATDAQAAGATAARNSATHGSRGATQSAGQGSSRRSLAQTTTQGSRVEPAAGNSSGITGVPRYRAGFRGRKGTTAPAATANVTVTGDNDGSVPKTAQSAVLPGISVMHNAFGIAKGTPIHVRLQQPVDSGHAKNGDIIRGVLTVPVGGVPAGSPVQLTVVAVAAAGQMTSNGELSLQVVSVNGETVISDVITAEGKEGAKLLPDDAPARGTEAVFTPDQPLTLPAG